MPNHAQAVTVPRDEDALGRTFRHLHLHQTGYANTMDEQRQVTALR